MVRFWVYLKLEPVEFPDGLDMVSARKRGVKSDPIFSDRSKFEWPVAAACKASR